MRQYRFTAVFDNALITEALRQKLNSYITEEKELIDGHPDVFTGCSVQMFDDILIDEQDESVKLVTVVVLYGSEVPNLLEMVYSFTCAFPHQVLPRYEHSKYALKDANLQFDDVE